MKNVTKLLVFAWSLALFTASCKKNVENEIVPQSDSIIDVIIDTISMAKKKEFNDAVSSWTSCVPQTQAINSPQQNGTPHDTLLGGYLQCHVTPMKIAPGFDIVKMFSPDNIHVGGWFNGTAIQSGQWGTVPVENFDSLKVSITLPTPHGTPPTTVINDPANHSEYLNAQNFLAGQAMANATPAYVAYDIDEIYSYDQTLVTIGASAGAWGGNIAAQFDFNDQEIQSRIMIKFIQKYYNIEMDIPNMPSDWFRSLPDYNMLQQYCPTYVSSVTYGRMVYVIIESKSSMSSTKAAVQASYSGFGYNFSFNYSQSNYSGVEIKSIKSFIVGGSSSFLSHGNMGDIGNIISSGAQFSQNSPGVPIAFTVRKVSDNNIVNFVTMAEYNVQECTVVGVPATVNLNPNTGHMICPAKIAGDDEYGGCVEITGNVTLELDQNQIDLWAVVDASYDECSNGDTRARINPNDAGSRIHLYTAPVGKTINSINVNNVTYFNHTDIENGNYAPFNISITSGFIDHITAVGDTEGDDLPCDGGNERAYFKIYFKDFGITLSN